MKTKWLISIFAALAFSASILMAFQRQQSPAQTYWKAELLWESFGVETFEQYKSWESMSIWRIYQSPDGIVRYEWENSSPPASLGVSGNISIIDYRSGTVLSFSRMQSTAFRSKLVETERNPFRPQSAPLGELTILGQKCKG